MMVNMCLDVYIKYTSKLISNWEIAIDKKYYHKLNLAADNINSMISDSKMPHCKNDDTRL